MPALSPCIRTHLLLSFLLPTLHTFSSTPPTSGPLLRFSSVPSSFHLALSDSDAPSYASCPSYTYGGWLSPFLVLLARADFLLLVFRFWSPSFPAVARPTLIILRPSLFAPAFTHLS
ncbi:hypothetical protein FB451DRAFT_1393521 [Mycena latifolia]|nr:hypothetical protein FB451DRAFT_1393521 [Mycena latifolia]